MHHNIATGVVVHCLGNLIHVEFTGNILYGEVGFVQVGQESLKSEVIEIDGKIAKMQVFEDTKGITLGSQVKFAKELLNIELGPGLLNQIFDGLLNPLEKIADHSGLFLERGVYIASLDRTKQWDFTPLAKVGDSVKRGDFLGEVPEGRYSHKIMTPFSLYQEYQVEWIIDAGSYTVDTVVAKLKSPSGDTIEVTMVQKWPIKFPLKQGTPIQAKKILSTGLRVIDTMFPMMKGGTTCSPGPFGSGKTVTQHTIAKYSNVDIVIVCACGERAGEVVEVIKEFPKLQDVYHQRPLMERMVVICNTSSMPVAARESSVYVGVTIAEYYRQMGLDILLLADSTSRWAQAMREMSGRLEEIPGEEAFPAYLASRIAAFYERAGAISLKNQDEGSVSILGAVSPAGGNFAEPVTQATLNCVGAFLCLSRELSDKRHYPSIDPLVSWSQYVLRVGEALSSEMPHWIEWVEKAKDILIEGDEILRRMEVVGQEGIPIEDVIKYLKARLFLFCYLQQNAFEKEDAYCSMDQQKRQFALMHKIFTMNFSFPDKDAATAEFLTLQNEIRQLNYMEFNSDRYNQAFAQVEEKLNKFGKE